MRGRIAVGVALVFLMTSSVAAQQISIAISPPQQAEGIGKTSFVITATVTGDFTASVLLRASAPTLPGATFNFVPPVINHPYETNSRFDVIFNGENSSGRHPIIVEAYNGPLLDIDTCYITVAKRLGWKVYTTENSPLPSNVIRSLVIDKNDVAWIGTDKGLVRFDGTDWRTYHRYNSSLINDGIDCLTLDSSGGLWAGLWEGLVEFRNDTFQTHAPTRVRSVTTDRNGGIWCSGDVALVQFGRPTSTFYTPENSSVLSGSGSMTFDKNNALWMTSGAFVSRFDGTYWTHYQLSSMDIYLEGVQELSTDHQGIVWGVAGQGVVKFGGTKPTAYLSATSNYAFPSMSPTHLCFDVWGAAWITSYNGFGRFEDSKWWYYDRTNSGMIDAKISSIKIDSRRTVYIGTNSGLVTFDGSLPPSSVPTSVDQDTVLPATTIITSIAPHPVSGVSAIHLNLVDDSHVRIAVHNSRGAEVVVLCDKMIDKGERQVQFDATGIAVGAYVLRLVAGDIVESRALIVSR